MTTTFERPFNFAHFNDSYQNGVHSKGQFLNQDHHHRHDNYVQLGKRSGDHYGNGAQNKNGTKRKSIAGDKSYQ